MSKLLKSIILGISIVAMQSTQAAEPITLTHGQLAQQITYIGTGVACLCLAVKVAGNLGFFTLWTSGMNRWQKSVENQRYNRRFQSLPPRTEADREADIAQWAILNHGVQKNYQNLSKKYACGLLFAGALLALQHKLGWNRVISIG